MSQRETFDYAIKIRADMASARAGLVSLQDYLLGGQKMAGALNSSLGKTALTLFSVYEATKLTLRGMQALTRGVMEFQTATMRLQAMGFTPRTMAEMVQASQSLTLTGRSVISTAGMIDIQSTLAARGIRGTAATSLMRQMGLQAESFVGQGADAAGAKDMAMQIAQSALSMSAFSKRSPEDIRSLDETLFRLSETMKEQFPGFIQSVTQLASTFPHISADGLRSMAAMSMLSGNPELASGMAGELRDFALGTNTRQALPFMAMSKMFDISPEAGIIRGRPFKLKSQFQDMIQQDPNRFLSEVLIPGLEKTGLSPKKTEETLQQVFGPDSDIARAARLIIDNQRAYKEDLAAAGAGMGSAEGAKLGEETSIKEAWGNFSTAIHNLTQNLQYPGVITTIQELTKFITFLGNFAKDNPQTAGGVAMGGTAVGGLLSFFGLRKLFKSMFGSKTAPNAKTVLDAMQEDMNGLKGGAPKTAETVAQKLTSAGPEGIERRAVTSALEKPGSWADMIESRGMQNTLLAKFIRNPAPVMEFLGVLARAGNFISLLMQPNTQPVGAGDLTAQERMQGIDLKTGKSSYGEEVHVIITVQDDHGHAMKHIVKSIHRAARNSTTPAGVHMSPILNGGS